MGPSRLAWSLLFQLWAKPAWRRLKGLSPGEGLRSLVFAVLAAFFIATIYSIFKPMTAFLWEQEELGRLLSARVLTLLFSFLFLLLGFSALLAFLNRLLFADDVHHFAASPVPPQAYFELRLAQAALGSAWMLALLWLPYLWALRRAMGASWVWLAWASLAPWPLAFLASALAAGLASALVGWLPPRRLRAGLFMLAFTGGILALLLLRASRPERLADPERARNVAAYLASLDQLEPAWWPPSWASRAVWTALDRPLEALAWWLLGVLAALASWRGVIRLQGGRAFRLWWRALDSGAGAASRPRRAFQAIQRSSLGRVLFQRELLYLSREPALRLQGLLLAALVALFIFSLWRLPVQGDQGMRDLLYLPVCALGQVVLVAVAARFIFPNASVERPGSWLLYSAPVRAWGHLAPKLLLFGGLLLPLSLLLWAATVRVFTPGPYLGAVGLVHALCLPWALAAMHLGLGTAWAREGANQAEDVISSASGVLLMVLSLFLVLGLNTLSGAALRQAWMLRYMRHGSVALRWSIAGCVLLWVVLLGLAASWPLILAKRRLEGRTSSGA